jgi:acyl-CoA synthetase (AMP-forming)/AMP-acid ligase II
MNRNIAWRLSLQAQQRPEQCAIASPVGSHRQGSQRRYHRLTFRELDDRSSSIAAGLQAMGMGPGLRIALLVPFGEDFITLVFALLKAGVTLILIDPGMGRRNLVRCLSAAEPDGFVAIPRVHAIRRALAGMFPRARWNVTVGRTLGIFPEPSLARLERTAAADYQPQCREESDPSAIIFTTGSTGPPKGVLYTHGTFHHQIDQLMEHYRIQPGGRDLSCFPLFGLFNAVMGTTTILPDMNPIRPADADPRRLLDAIDQWSINQAFGSPALWTAVGTYLEKSGRRVPSLTQILSAGAPVSPRILRWMRQAIDSQGQMHTPYGATEALPVASIESREVLQETAAVSERGGGTCVGRKFSGIDWRVIAIEDRPLTDIDQVREVGPGEIGELMVSGPVVSPTYVTRTEQNALHKVHDGPRLWHRLGDVGYLDSQQRFWYCGRKSHRVRAAGRTLFTEPCEAIINTHRGIYRSALLGIGPPGQQRPVVVVEPWPEYRPRPKTAAEAKLLEELHALARSEPISESIEDFCVYPRALPTDIRHNSKIFREQLVPWYTRRSRS